MTLILILKGFDYLRFGLAQLISDDQLTVAAQFEDTPVQVAGIVTMCVLDRIYVRCALAVIQEHLCSRHVLHGWAARIIVHIEVVLDRRAVLICIACPGTERDGFGALAAFYKHCLQIICSRFHA